MGLKGLKAMKIFNFSLNTDQLDNNQIFKFIFKIMRFFLFGLAESSHKNLKSKNKTTFCKLVFIVVKYEIFH